MPPETRYAKSGGVHIAYQVVGAGPDLILVPGWISHVEMMWEEPALARYLERLASFSRLIMIDKRGTGLSDPVSLDRVPTLEQRMDDVRAVMDAVDSERAALLGVSEGGPMNILFAATYPERTSALVLLGTFARAVEGDDYPIGVAPERLDDFLEQLAENWGDGQSLWNLAPSVAADERMRASWARFERMSASPGAATTLLRMVADIDVRHILSSVHVPTLVLHRTGDTFVPLAQGRYLAEHIPGARFVELPGTDHLYFVGDTGPLLDEVEVFLTGQRQQHEADRVLATVLFTDIVDSTRHAAELGDRRWRDLLDSHDALVRRQVERFRGRAVKGTGDGVLATFDGPARAIRSACAIVEAARQLGVELRAGLHTGECEVRGDDLGGIAVHIGARVAAMAAPGEVLASSTVKDLVAGSGLRFADRGSHVLKGVPGEWRIYAAYT
jgi:class 3 adenylate cyclase/alpha-beta hydrolase superfamily lysophospholipase